MTVVVAGVIERDGRVLVCQRRADQPHPLKWEFPGGKVEPGETPEEALHRELREELGTTATIGRELERYSFQYPGKTAILLIFFEVAAVSGELRNRIFERTEWATPGELSAYDFLEGDAAFVARLCAAT